MSQTVTFAATVAKVQTQVDKGIRVTFDLPEGAVLPASELMAIYAADVVLDVTCVVREKQEAKD